MNSRVMRGMSFMDVIIGTALVLVIFTALVGLLRSSLQVASVAKTRSIATAVAESQMEYIRALAYDEVGTVGGIPAGNIPQYATTTSNGIAFPVRTFIEYVDDPADGSGNADENSITTDYKRIKVTVSYYANNRTQTIDLVTNYAPPDLETTTNGGTLKVSVVNATGTGVSGATVRIVNSALAPTIDLTTYTDTSGTVFLPGAPTSTQYQIFVSKTGYSSTQTYERDATNQNPNPGYLTVVKNQTTTGTFSIDLLATLTLKTWYPIATSTYSDSFATSGGLSAQANTVVAAGGIQLQDSGTGYPASGSAQSIAVTPTYLAAWGMAYATTTTPGGTTLRFHVVDGSGASLPDVVVPGNSAGFTSSINLSSVSTTTYPSLSLVAELTTSSTTTTPVLQSWSLSYARGPVPFPSVPFTLTGNKTIGSTGAGLPLYKTTVSTTTGASASQALSLEWDAYTLGLTSYDVVSVCSTVWPYTLSPGSSVASSLFLASSTSNMALVTVRDTNGSVANASVTLSNGSYNTTIQTDACGSAYFGGLTSGSYSVTASKTGYTTFNASGVSISGHTFYPIAF